jgi:hypothetical protein
MHYDEFRDRFQEVLHAVGLFYHQWEKPIETIDLANTSRRWKAYSDKVRPEARNHFTWPEGSPLIGIHSMPLADTRVKRICSPNFLAGNRADEDREEMDAGRSCVV